MSICFSDIDAIALSRAPLSNVKAISALSRRSIGEVPEHWDVCLLKRAFRAVDYGISDSLNSEGVVAILRMGNIANGKIVTDNIKYTDAVDGALLLQAGDLLSTSRKSC
jgi:hypothetical protein